MVADEQYIFKADSKKNLTILFVAGLVLFVIGVFMAMNAGEGHEGGHASLEVSKNLVASTESVAVAVEAAGEHHGSPIWLKRIYTSLWHNNIFFAGLGIIGLFFVAIQYAAQAGWSAPIKRIPLAIGHWIPIAGVLTLIIWFVANGDLFHWTHHDLYDKASPDYDKILDA
jgi:drug/metabolite transporter (DMT)-like permease